MNIRNILIFVIIIGLGVFSVGCNKSDTESNEVNEKYDYDFDNDELYENGEKSVHDTLMKQKENQDLELLDDIFLAIKVGLNTDALYNELQDLIPEKSMNKFTFEDLVAGNTEFDELNGIMKDKIGNDKELVAECNKDCDIIIAIMNDDVFEISVYVATSENTVVKCEYIKDDKDGFKEMLVCTTNLSEYKVMPDFFGLTEVEATELLEKNGITYVFTLENDNVVEKGKVFKQSIDAGTAVPKESEITIFLSDGVKEPVWLVKPTYSFEDVQPLKEHLPIQRISFYTWLDETYKARYFFVENGKNGMIDDSGSILVGSSADLYTCPFQGIVSKNGMSYDTYGNELGYKGGAGGPSIYYWNEKTGKLASISPDGAYELDGFKKESEFMHKAQAMYGDVSLYNPGNPDIFDSLLKNYYKLINKNGYLVTEESFENIKVQEDWYYSVQGKYAAVKKNGLWGYIDESGNWLLECQYDDAYQFCDGIAAVKKDGKAGFIKEDGSVAVDFIFEETRTANEGKAWVKYEGKWGVIDIKAMME